MLKAHLRARASGERLRRRVNELQAPSGPKISPPELHGDVSEGYDSLEDFDPYDSTHLFWEEIKQLGFAFRQIRREDLDDQLLEELLKAAEPVWSVLRKIESRRHKEVRKLIF